MRILCTIALHAQSKLQDGFKLQYIYTHTHTHTNTHTHTHKHTHTHAHTHVVHTESNKQQFFIN